MPAIASSRAPDFLFNPARWGKNLLYRVGFAIREWGVAIERQGALLQGTKTHEEEFLRNHAPLQAERWAYPVVGDNTWIAPSAMVRGDVKMGSNCSVWYNAVVRSEWITKMTIGDNVNIQDNAIVGTIGEYAPDMVIGNNVSIGHSAVVKGATIGDNVLIGMGAVVSEGCEIQPYSIVAAGAYLEEDTEIASGEVWAGAPAKKLRDLKPEEHEYLKSLPQRYVELAEQHREITKMLEQKQEEYYS